MRRWFRGIVLGLLILSIGQSAGLVSADESALPELHPQKIVIDPAVPVEQGKFLTVKVDIVNTGETDAKAFNIDYAWRTLGSNMWTTFATEELAGLRVVDQEVTRTVTLDTGSLNGGSPGPLIQQTSFELRATLDAENKVAEQDESNNELRTSVTVFPNLALGKADLRPSTLNFDPISPVSLDSRRADGSQSDVISIVSAVENIGEKDASPFSALISYCAIPISQIAQSCPQALTPLQTQIENQNERALGGLPEGGSLSFKADLPFRSGNNLLLESGTYLFQVEVDTLDEVEEQDEANNVVIGFLTIRGPELRPTRIDLGASPVRQGDVVDVIAHIANNGVSTVRAGYQVAFFVNGIPFGRVDGPAIDAGGQNAASAQLDTTKFNLAAGRAHTIRVLVDADNAIFEPDETNNVLETALTLLPGPPALAELHPKDIVLTPPSPLEKLRDDRLTVKSHVINTGNAAAADFAIELSFRAQGAQRWRPMTCITPPFNCRNQTLGAGQELQVQGELFADELDAGVTYEVRVVVDPGIDEHHFFGTVPELDENNNVMETSFTVRAPQLPDLAVSRLSFIPQDLSNVRRGQQIQLVAGVSNLGEVNVSQPFDVECRLTNLITFVEFDCFGEGRRAVRDLAVNREELVQFLIDTTPLDPGFYQIAVVLDPQNVVKELDEGNNVAFTSSDPTLGAVLVVQGPDLTVLPVFDAPVPAQVAPGQPVSFKVLVLNQGLENAARFVVRLVVECPGQASRAIDQPFLGLGALDSVTVSFTFGNSQNAQDPTGPLQEGLCTLNVLADPQDLVKELNEQNNALFPQDLPFQLQVGTGSGQTPGAGGTPSGGTSGQSEADLVIDNFALSKGLVTQGAKFKFQFDVLNQGIQDAGSFTVRVFYMRVGSGSETEIDRFRIDFLGVKQFITMQATLDTASLEPGHYKLVVVVDSFNEVEESFEANNRQERWLRVN